MAKKLQYRRLFWLALLLAAGFLGLGYRLVDLQVWRHETLRARSLRQTQWSQYREPRRGDIRDSRGNLLATSEFVKTVCADPTLVGEYARESARILAPLLGVEEGALCERLRPRVLRYGEGQRPVYDRYVVLKRKVRLEDWENIREAMKHTGPGAETVLDRKQRLFLQHLRERAVFADPRNDQLRIYPMERLASHLLGFTGMGETGGGEIDLEGKDGIERVLNAILRGVGGWRRTERDQRGRELMTFRNQDVEPRDGLTVVLTIDAGLQQIVEEELSAAMELHDPVSVSAIVVRPRTGSIAALATLPNFDPNDPGSAPVAARRNRAISDISEPGSTFKIVVVAAALNEGVVQLEDQFDCEQGRVYFAGHWLTDHEPNGMLTVERIVARSSNIGAFKVGLKLGPEALHRYIRAFGFGERTGISLPGEVAGTVHPLERWSRLSISRLPMGYEVGTTPLQMAMAMSAIANEGRLMRPMLIERLEDASGRIMVQYQPQTVRHVIRPETARWLTTALKSAVSTNGTGVKAMFEQYTVAGKTGTARKAGPRGYERGKYFASFIGFFPADDPELCISVVIDEPRRGYYGGQTAAPIFRGVAERAAKYLGIQPDAPPAGNPGVQWPPPLTAAVKR